MWRGAAELRALLVVHDAHQRAGEPCHISLRPITFPGVSSAPAASMPPSSITAPSSTVAPMATKARSFSVQACTMAAWPTVTSSPMMVGWLPALTWMMVPSWMFVRAPMRMKLVSPRSDAMEPDTGERADLDVADHRRARRHEGVRRDPLLALEGVERAGITGRSCMRRLRAARACRPSIRRISARRRRRRLCRDCPAAPPAPPGVCPVGEHAQFQHVGVVQCFRFELGPEVGRPPAPAFRRRSGRPAPRAIRAVGLPASVSRCSGTETSMPWR